MLRTCRILVSSIALAASTVVLAGCGQTGPLYLPTEPAAAQRATLPEVLVPGRTITQPAAPAAPLLPSSSPRP